MSSVPVAPAGAARGFALALTGAVLFSAKAIVVKLAYRHAVDAVTLLALRMTLSLPFFVAAAIWTRHRHQATHVRLSRMDLLRIGFLGFMGYYLASFLDFVGLQYISAGLERLILFLYPTIVLLLSVWVLGRRVTRWQVGALALSYAGIGVVFMHDMQVGGSDVALGAALVFLSAIVYAIYLVASGEIVRRVGSIRLTAYATIVACLLCMGQYLFTHSVVALAAVPSEVWWLSLFNAVFCTVVPVFATMAAVSRIGAPAVSIAGMIGPIATIFMGALVLDEALTSWQLAGTFLVIAGVFMTTRTRT